MSEPAAAPADVAALFVNTCYALSCGRMRLRPRERQLGLALAVESFGRGQRGGQLDTEAIWEHLKPEWRRNEVTSMIEQWRRARWLATDAAQFRLAPDRLPGWAECFELAGGNPGLDLPPGEHLGNLVAELSQDRAAAARLPVFSATAKISQSTSVPANGGTHCENFAVGKGPPGNELEPNCENFAPPLRNVTFKRTDVKDLKRNVTLEGTAKISQATSVAANAANAANALKEKVRKFVGESDWENPYFWNKGNGWRAGLFTEEGETVEAALRYVVAGLKSGDIVCRRTRGAMLWDQIQRERRAALQEGK